MGEQNNPKIDHIDTDAEKKEKDKKEFDWFELDSRFLLHVIQNKPELHYHDEIINDDDPETVPACSDSITLIWNSEDEEFGPRKIMLDRDGDAKRNENGDDLGFHEAEPTVVQIAKLVALYGKPDKIRYLRFDTLWRFKEIDKRTGKEPKFDFLPHESEFNYFSFKNDILKEAYSQFPQLADMSLAEIGRILAAS